MSGAKLWQMKFLDRVSNVQVQKHQEVMEFIHYRQQRLKQIQEEASKRRFGSVLKIVREQFVAEVTEASKQSWVVVHLYKDK